jgi:hypothetical protein
MRQSSIYRALSAVFDRGGAHTIKELVERCWPGEPITRSRQVSIRRATKAHPRLEQRTGDDGELLVFSADQLGYVTSCLRARRLPLTELDDLMGPGTLPELWVKLRQNPDDKFIMARAAQKIEHAIGRDVALARGFDLEKLQAGKAAFARDHAAWLANQDTRLVLDASVNELSAEANERNIANAHRRREWLLSTATDGSGRIDTPVQPDDVDPSPPQTEREIDIRQLTVAEFRRWPRTVLPSWAGESPIVFDPGPERPHDKYDDAADEIDFEDEPEVEPAIDIDDAPIMDVRADVVPLLDDTYEDDEVTNSGAPFGTGIDDEGDVVLDEPEAASPLDFHGHTHRDGQEGTVGDNRLPGSNDPLATVERANKIKKQPSLGGYCCDRLLPPRIDDNPFIAYTQHLRMHPDVAALFGFEIEPRPNPFTAYGKRKSAQGDVVTFIEIDGDKRTPIAEPAAKYHARMMRDHQVPARQREEIAPHLPYPLKIDELLYRTHTKVDSNPWLSGPWDGTLTRQSKQRHDSAILVMAKGEWSPFWRTPSPLLVINSKPRRNDFIFGTLEAYESLYEVTPPDANRYGVKIDGKRSIWGVDSQLSSFFATKHPGNERFVYFPFRPDVEAKWLRRDGTAISIELKRHYQECWLKQNQWFNRGIDGVDLESYTRHGPTDDITLARVAPHQCINPNYQKAAPRETLTLAIWSAAQRTRALDALLVIARTRAEDEEVRQAEVLVYEDPPTYGPLATPLRGWKPDKGYPANWQSRLKKSPPMSDKALKSYAKKTYDFAGKRGETVDAFKARYAAYLVSRFAPGMTRHGAFAPVEPPAPEELWQAYLCSTDVEVARNPLAKRFVPSPAEVAAVKAFTGAIQQIEPGAHKLKLLAPVAQTTECRKCEHRGRPCRHRLSSLAYDFPS